jgi:hypothetical protein
MNGIFVDTAEWMACADEGDPEHARARESRDVALEQGMVLIIGICHPMPGCCAHRARHGSRNGRLSRVSGARSDAGGTEPRGREAKSKATGSRQRNLERVPDFNVIETR